MTIGSREPRSVDGLRDAESERERLRERLANLAHAEAQRNDLQGAVEEWKSLRGIQKTERDRLRFDLDRYAERWVEAGEVVRIRVAERDQAIAARDRLRAKSLRCWKPLSR